MPNTTKATGSDSRRRGRTSRQDARWKLPRRFVDLVRRLPPQAICNDDQHAVVVEMIDRLMACESLSDGQATYLETLVQLVQAYESTHHAIDVSHMSALEALKHLLVEHGMSASNLAELLDVHTSMGSKILNGERSLTVEHIKKLSRRFRQSPEAFID